MRKSAFALIPILLAAACKSSKPSSDSPAETTPADLSAQEPGQPGAQQPGGELERDVQTLSLADQRKVFLVEQHLVNARRLAQEGRLEEALRGTDAALSLEPESLKAKSLRNELRALRGEPGATNQ